MGGNGMRCATMSNKLILMPASATARIKEEAFGLVISLPKYATPVQASAMIKLDKIVKITMRHTSVRPFFKYPERIGADLAQA